MLLALLLAAAPVDAWKTTPLPGPVDTSIPPPDPVASPTDLGDIAPSTTPLVSAKNGGGRVPSSRPTRPAVPPSSGKAVPIKPVATSPGF